MAVYTQVRVHAGTTWSAVSTAADIRLRRKAGAGEASFRVPNASGALKNLLRTGRECEVSITVDGAYKVFGGFIDRPEIEVVAPGHYNILVRVVDLSHGAGWQRIVPASIASGTKYTDMLKQLWAQSWDVVETITGVADHDLTHPETYRPGHDHLASVTDDHRAPVPAGLVLVGEPQRGQRQRRHRQEAERPAPRPCGQDRERDHHRE